MRDVLTLTQQLAHPYSRGFALTFAAWLHQWRLEPAAVLQHVAASLTLAREHHFPLLLAHGMTLQGWAQVTYRQEVAGLEQIRQGLAAYQATGTGLARAYFLSLLAEALQKADQIEAGLATLAEAATLIETHGEYWWHAEILRLRGEFLLQRAPQALLQAEALLHQALDVAHRQHARSLELRAAVSLGRLWQQHGHRERARQVLEPLYSWFTEGFDTADLTEAKALLEALS